MKWLTAPTPVTQALLIWSLGVLGGLIGVPLGIWSAQRRQRLERLDEALLDVPGVVLRPGERRRKHTH